MDQTDLAERLRAAVGRALGKPVVIEALTRLPGGASKDTWSFSARGPDGPAQRFVVRGDRDRMGLSGSRLGLEAALLTAAAAAGVPVPSVVAVGEAPDAPGAAFLVMEFVDGETIPRRILRDEELGGARALLAEQCGRILADIHRIPPSAVPGLAGGDLLDQLRDQLDGLGEPHPAFELGLLWLAATRPPPGAPGVVHGDFRNGNLIVGTDGIRAVLDWELAHLGEPLEDLGWLCVKAWRFGSPLPVGGFGTLEQLIAAYEAAGGGPVDEEILHWWIVFGTLRWGIICIAQALTHLSGAARSVELAAIGRRVCEVESDLLELLPWTESGGKDDASAPPVGVAKPPGPAGEWSSRPPHDAPSAAQLLEAVREFLASDVLGATEGRVRFHVRVAANVIAMVGRELQLGTELAAAHALRLAGLGVSSEAELASAIRAGAFADRLGAVSDSVRATVAGKLAVANPAYRQGPAPPVGE
jgi:aminoglycoside phosphotransferase (APT) family kinase protein